MGITRQGKVAVLTNYREEQPQQAVGAQSRGLIVNSWLTSPSPSGTEAEQPPKQSTRGFVDGVIRSITATKVGGFSLVCGYVNEPLAVVSNRSHDLEQVSWVATERGQTLGLSNTSFDDRSWPKIVDGERLMDEAIAEHVRAGAGDGAGEDEDALIQKLLQVLSRDTFPRIPGHATAETHGKYLRNSIFIPVIGQTSTDPYEDCSKPEPETGSQYTQGPYGTQKQTVLLVRQDGRVRYFERTLYDNDTNAIPAGRGDRSFEFMT